MHHAFWPQNHSTKYEVLSSRKFEENRNSLLLHANFYFSLTEEKEKIQEEGFIEEPQLKE